ncbi:hypothetical protein TNCV_679861 [Trichonephila clavipes]|nr:hypothetical protein TNCV_679861 [Trichonephila clavipes]
MENYCTDKDQMWRALYETGLACNRLWKRAKKTDARGPVFRHGASIESRILSNNSGTETACYVALVYCRIASRLNWLTREGGTARDVPGLRHTSRSMEPGIPHSRGPSIGQDVHDAVYAMLRLQPSWHYP